MHNPDCDGPVTGSCDGYEVRVLPYPGGNLNLCRRHYGAEMRYRVERNKSVASPYALPAWESLAKLRDDIDAQADGARAPLSEYEDSRDVRYCYACRADVQPTTDEGETYCPRCESSDLSVRAVKPATAYPWCLTPSECAGRGYCPRNPNCGE